MLIEKKYDEQKQCWQIWLFGDIDLYNADELRAGFADVGDNDVCIHCENLKYIDSTGLGVLVSVLKAAREKGHVVSIEGLKPYIYRIFELTDLHKLFQIEVAK